MTTEIPIVCDMTTAPDTLAGRMAEYTELFDAWLAGRERRGDAIRFRFRADPGVEEHVRDLAAREKACCAFFSFQITVADGEVRWDLAVPGDPAARWVLDRFYELAGTPPAGEPVR